MREDSLDASTLQAAMTNGQSTVGTGEAWATVAAFTVLYHPDLGRVGERAVLRELTRGGTARLSRREPLFAAPGGVREQPLHDPHLSRQPWELTATKDGGIRVDPASSRAVLKLSGAPWTSPRIVSAAELDSGVVVELADRVVLLLHHHRVLASAEPRRWGLVGDSSAVLRLRRDIEMVADLDVAVLLRGETGTGKELVASAIHRASGRRGAFVAVNLAAIPASLASAELFGVSKGAFTGATQAQVGYFARAEGGTLFLDEIGETPTDVQVQLLRALETGEIQPLGGRQPHRLDVRLISATDADLEAAIESGAFRAPLLHRLAGYEIPLPALRRRRDDIGRLWLHFLRGELREVGEEDRLEARDATTWIPPGLIARLVAFDWPGNVRQLKNVVRQLVIGSRGLPRMEVGAPVERLLVADDPSQLAVNASGSTVPARNGPARNGPARNGARRKPATVSEEELCRVLRNQRWDFKATADHLRISRTSLYALIEKFPGVRAPGDITNDEIQKAFRECDGDQNAMVEKLEVSLRALRRRLREMGLL